MEAAYIKKELIEQKKSNFKGNIYHWTQVNFAYNSNKIEGGCLTEEQTEMIFETHSFITKADESVKMDDLMESVNHFRLFDYMLDNIDIPLSVDMILEMSKILKRNTADELNPRYNVGGFKIIPNIIGMIHSVKTTDPKDVENELEKLLDCYNHLETIEMKEIINFHLKFERIHPLANGNGRVGRMIMFKECLKNDIIPFIILDQDKAYYLRGLREYDNNQTYLIDTCLHSQDIYENAAEQFLDYELTNEEELDNEINL